MAELIDKGVVVKGRMLKVRNTKKLNFSHANTFYYAIWVEDAKGGNEHCLLFTKREIESGEYRASKNKEDIPVKSLLMDILD